MAKKCPKCGNEYPDSENFCMECGGRLKAVKMERPVSRKLEASISGIQDRLNGIEEELEDLKRVKARPEIRPRRGPGPVSRELEADLSGIQDRLNGIERELKGLKDIRDKVRQEINKEVACFREMEKSVSLGVEGKKKLEEDLILHQQNRLMVMEAGIKRRMEALEKARTGLEQGTSNRARLNTVEIERLKAGFEDLSGLRKEVNKRLKGLRQEFENRVADVKKLEEDLALQQQSKLMSLETRVNERVEGIRQGAEKTVSAAAARAAGNIEERLGEVRKLRARLSRLSVVEKGIASRVREMEGLRQEIADAEERMGAVVSRVEGISASMESERGFRQGLGKRIDANALNIKRLDRAIEALRKRVGSPGRGLREMVAGIEASSRENREQFNMMKEFIENLEKRVKTETGGLEKRIEEIAGIQEKQELEILSPRTKNISRIIKTQVKNEAGDIEKRILKRIGRRL